jgi:hypothetical protein
MWHTRGCAYGTSHIGVELRLASIGRRVEHVKRGSAHHHGGASSIVRCVIVGANVVRVETLTTYVLHEAQSVG